MEKQNGLNTVEFLIIVMVIGIIIGVVGPQLKKYIDGAGANFRTEQAK